MSRPAPSLATNNALLARIRQNPQRELSADPQHLSQVFAFVNSRDTSHLVCEKAVTGVVESAAYLLKQIDSRGDEAASWRNMLGKCLRTCRKCGSGFTAVKESAQLSYLSCYREDQVENFMRSVVQWEISVVMQGLRLAESAHSKHLPSELVWFIVDHLYLVQEPRLLPQLRSQSPESSFMDWPASPPPPGLLVLMFDESDKLRTWATEQVSRCSDTPLPVTALTEPHRKALRTVLGIFRAKDGAQKQHLVPLWRPLGQLIRLVPSELIGNDFLTLDFHKIVMGHLHDNIPEFEYIILNFLQLLTRLQDRIWSGEEPDYPQVVFDSIRDNPALLDDLQTPAVAGQRSRKLLWITPFLKSVWSSNTYGEILARAVDFLCSGLQHDRFANFRPEAFLTAVQLLSTQLAKCRTGPVKSRHRAALSHVFQIHAEALTAVAFGRSHEGPVWSSVRGPARDLVISLLSHDIQAVSSSITLLGEHTTKNTYNYEPPAEIELQLWKAFQSSIQSKKAEDIATAINLAAEMFQFDLLKDQSHRIVARSAKDPNDKTKEMDIADRKKIESQMRGAARTLNQYIGPMLDVVFGTLTRICDENISSTVLLDALGQGTVVKNIIKLAMSADERVQSSALGLIGVAYDVDERAEQFRSLIRANPISALQGLCEYLQTFYTFAHKAAEACNLSKTLVQCFTDILDVLYTSPNGLLHDPTFFRPEIEQGLRSQLRKMWKLMTSAIGVIFGWTPDWAPWISTDLMTPWMRDALIFGRDLLAQREIIEYFSIDEQNGTTSVRKSMLADLQTVLHRLARWLKLTDPELLHQSFALLQSLLALLLENNMELTDQTTQKLQREIDASRKHGLAKTKLNSDRILELEDALNAFKRGEVIEISEDEATLAETGTSSEVELVSDGASVSGVSTSNKKGKSSIKPSTKEQKDRKDKPAPKDSLSHWISDHQSKSKPVKQKLKGKAGLALTPAQKAQLEDVSLTMPTFRPKKSVVSLRGSSNTPSTSARQSEADSDGSSSSDDEADDKEQGLAQLAKMQKPKQVHKPRPQIKIIADPRLTQDPRAKLERAKCEEARRRFARRNPDLAPLHKVLLSWNYDHEGQDPPTFDTRTLKRIPDRFQDFAHYRSVFEPLLLLECWSQIVDSKQQPPEIVDFKITAKRSVDAWIDVDATFAEGVIKQRKDWSLNETDVVLLRHPEGQKSIMAKVQSYSSNPTRTAATLRCYIAPGGIDPGLQINSVWKVSKVFSLSTLHREYAALTVVGAIDCESLIYAARLPRKYVPSASDLRQTMEKYHVNEPQAQAICSSMQSEGFTLIQGPPGTGKTSTICALVESFITNRPKPATNVTVGQKSTQADRQPPQKVLICAPSNAAIDEVASRVRDGPKGGSRRLNPLNVIRVGAEQSMNVSVKDISLDNLVEQRMSKETGGQDDDRREEASLRTELDSIKREKDKHFQEMENLHDNAARSSVLQEDIRALNAKRIRVTQKLDRLRDQRKSNNRSLDAKRRAIRAGILQEADVICTTLAGAGHDQLNILDFEMIIIDEAAQAVELSALIPMKYNAKRCIMVGDPQQLPPTVLSGTAKRFLYDQSFFVRLHKSNPDAAYLLSIQYRMHPSISSCPSRLFYQGALQDGPDMATKTRQQWHENTRFGPYKFFNVVAGQEETTRSHSHRNRAECQVILALYQRLRQEYVTYDFDFKIGIVSMYKAQVTELKRVFETKYGQDILGRVDFHTVDGFQGQEKEIIILSCVRAGPGVQRVGFLADVRRMNVAMTRAKSSLFIVGNAATLERSDETWKTIITDAKERGYCVEADTAYFTSAAQLPPAPASSPKKNSKKAIALQPPPPPSDLMTPQQLKRTGSKPKESFSEPSPMDIDTTGPSKSPDVSAPRGVSSGNDPQTLVNGSSGKRKAEDRPPEGADGATSQPRPPPPKRKKKEASMFIPKPRR